MWDGGLAGDLRTKDRINTADDVDFLMFASVGASLDVGVLAQVCEK
jgi:hypothetical protein